MLDSHHGSKAVMCIAANTNAGNARGNIFMQLCCTTRSINIAAPFTQDSSV